MNWIARHRRLVLALICAFWTGAVVLALRYPDSPFLSAVARGEQSFQDLLRREGRKTLTREISCSSASINNRCSSMC